MQWPDTTIRCNGCEGASYTVQFDEKFFERAFRFDGATPRANCRSAPRFGRFSLPPSADCAAQSEPFSAGPPRLTLALATHRRHI
jgi:hypothetical protein